jgi:hypothetical protein
VGAEATEAVIGILVFCAELSAMTFLVLWVFAFCGFFELPDPDDCT